MSIVFYPLLKVNDVMETERELITQEDKEALEEDYTQSKADTSHLSYIPIQML